MSPYEDDFGDPPRGFQLVLNLERLGLFQNQSRTLEAKTSESKMRPITYYEASGRS